MLVMYYISINAYNALVVMYYLLRGWGMYPLISIYMILM